METFRGVVLTCRAFRAETELLLYSENIFSCRKELDWYPWVRLLGAKRRDAIRTVLIDDKVRSAMEWFARVDFSRVAGTLVKRGSDMNQWWQALQASEIGSHFKIEEETDGEVTWFTGSWK
jgi:hypothetical protein